MSIQFLPWTISGLSPNAPGSAVVGNAISGLQEFSKATIEAELNSATGGALNIFIQSSYDGKHVSDSTKQWFDVIAYTQIAAASGPVAKTLATIIRGITGAAPQALTQGTLAAGTVLQNMLGDALRVFAVAAAGTSAGGQQIVNIAMVRSP